MKTFNLFIILGLIFFNFSVAQAGIPYCSKKIKTDCVKPKPGQTDKFYVAPKYKEITASVKVKSKAKSAKKQHSLATKSKKPKVLAKNTSKKSKNKSALRKTASDSSIKLKKVPKTKKKTKKKSK